MLSAKDIENYISFARGYEAQGPVGSDCTISPATTASTFSSLDLGSDAVSSTTSYNTDTHTPSYIEAQCYYAGLHSEPMLLYRTGKEWIPPSGPEAYRRLKELCEVFNHPITKVWNHDLGWKVVNIMDTHTVSQ